MSTSTGELGTGELLNAWLARRLAPAGLKWLHGAQGEIGAGVAHARFATTLSLASRHVPRAMLAPGAAEIAAAYDACEGWNPERWTLLECARVVLVLARDDLERPSAVEALEEAFRYADIGELCALHRSLAHLPLPQRFVWRAGEGCRTSMGAVFEAAACDTPFPALHFDPIGWRQLVIKCLFVEAPLWRVHGLDRRLDAELARMALDLAEERRAAGRPVQHELWLCLGKFGGERGRASLERELAGDDARGRGAAALALARTGELERLSALRQREQDPEVAAVMSAALKGRIHASAWRALDPREAGAAHAAR